MNIANIVPNVLGHEKLFSFYFDDFHLGHRAVAAVSLDCSNLVDNIQTLNSFTKNGVGPIQLCTGLLVLHDVELGARGFLHGIGGISAAGSRKGAFLVAVRRQYLGWDGVSGAAGAKAVSVCRILGERVSTLDHEVTDDPVEQE